MRWHVHTPGPMSNLVQSCTVCGCVLEDYRGAAWLSDDGPPKGYGEGLPLARSEGSNPRVTMTVDDDDIRRMREAGDVVAPCVAGTVIRALGDLDDPESFS